MTPTLRQLRQPDTDRTSGGNGDGTLGDSVPTDVRGATSVRATGALDVGRRAAEGDIHGGRPTVADRQPPATDAARLTPQDDIGSTVDGADLAGVRPARSLLATAVMQTLGRWGARIGLTWVVLLILLAVFAPFIANSRPYYVRLPDGTWISPLWRSLTLIDIALPLMLLGVTALALAAWQFKLLRKAMIPAAAGLVLASLAVGWALADPPLLERLSQYRQAQERGSYEQVVFAPIPFSPNDRMSDLGDARALAPFWKPNEKAANFPSDHWLGTTINGEDMASRMIHATRVALAIGFIATSIAVVIGVIVGAIMGYAGGIVDLLLMRFIEILQAVPILIVLLIVMSFFGKNIWLMMTTIGLLAWTTNARFIRAEFLRLRGMDFVQAARAAGLPVRSLLFRHMLPNGVAPVLVNASFGVATAILFESTLSFLGLGLEAKDPSWGQLLNQARSGGTGFNWWIAIFPGLAIFLTVFAYILIGEALRDALDPKLAKQA
ncbi:MAG: ABC transporter permease [Phycisphaerae bacterium]